MPLPTDEEPKIIVRNCLNFYADRKDVHSYMEDYFMTNYSSVGNMTQVISKLWLKQHESLFAESESKWFENLKQVE